MSEQIDYNQFKRKQRESWNASAEGWRKWYKAIEESGAHRVTARLLELAQLKSTMWFWIWQQDMESRQYQLPES